MSTPCAPSLVTEFAQYGITRPFPVLSPDEMLERRAACNALFATASAAGHDSYAINGQQTTCATIYDLVTLPALLDAVEALIGPDIIAWGTHFFCKLPGDSTAVSWHQDAPYWPMTPMRTVTAWLAIDDADPGNGGMRVVTGSHRLGVLPRRPSRPEERNVLWETIDDAERHGKVHAPQWQAGEATLHHDLLVHGSLPNLSPRRRCGLTVRYCTPEVRSTADWHHRAIICRGQDPGGYWRHHPRPENDLLKLGNAMVAAN